MPYPIRRRLLPGTDLTLSVIVLGGVPFGGDTSEDDSFRLLDTYVARGGNFVDTAEVYSNWLPGPRSVSESRIGKWLRARGLADQITVATKGGHQRLETMDIFRLKPEDLRFDIDGSLERLGLDTIPLYYLHRDDPSIPVGEIMATLAEAVAAGKIRYLGCSNWKRDRIIAAQAWAAAHGMPGFVVNQPRFSLAPVNPEGLTDPAGVEMDEELYAYHMETNMPVVAYSSQAQGFFSGVYGRTITQPKARFGPKVIFMYASEANYARLDRVTQLACQLGRSPTHVALAWLMAQPFPVFPAVGPASLAHLEDSLGAHDLDLTPDQARWLDRG